MSITIHDAKEAAEQAVLARKLLCMSRKERRAGGVRMPRAQIENLLHTFESIEFAEEES